MMFRKCVGVRFGLVQVIVGVALGALGDPAKTVWVDAANAGRSELNGSETAAYATIQDAIDNASSGDVIKVRPGVYDQGGSPLAGYKYALVHRVMLDKKLTIESTGGRDVTHIVGHKDYSKGDQYGRGLEAVRCVGVSSAGVGSRLVGFTLRDSATYAGTAESALTNCAGGVYVYGATANQNFVAIDCAISNCAAGAQGGGVRGGLYFNCLFANNVAGSTGSAACHAGLVNCVVSRSRGQISVVAGTSYAVNCTIVGNRSSNMGDTRYYNCIFSCNANGDSEVYANRTACVSGADGFGRYQLVGPAVGDYRPLATSDAVGRGETRYLNADRPFEFPADVKIRDMAGRPIDLAKATCTAGAYQETVTPAHGGLQFNEKTIVNGNEMHGTSYFFATEWPMQVHVRPFFDNASTVFFRYKLADAISSAQLNAGAAYPPLADRGARSRWAQPDGSLYLMPPCFPGEILTNTAETVDVTYYVNGDLTDYDGHTGTTPELALKTIQEAVDKCTRTDRNYRILVAPGDYDEGGRVANGVMTRVVVPEQRYLLIQSTEGAARTTIRGAADTTDQQRDAQDHPGLGPNAVRCVFIGASGCAFALQGFTLADGHTDYANPDSATTTSDLCGGFHGPKTDGARAASQLLDCVVTNCSGSRGGAVIYAWASRCRIVGNRGHGDVVRYAFLSSCFVKDNTVDADGRIFSSETYSFNGTCPDVVLTASSFQYNSLFGDQAQTIPSSSQYWGSLFAGATGKGYNAQGVTLAVPAYRDAAAGDWRVLAGSEAARDDGRAFPSAGDANWGKFATNLAQFASSDLTGRPWAFGGRYPVAGCLQETVPAVKIAGSAGLLSAEPGYHALDAGETFTVTRAERPARNVAGVVVNGETHLFADGAWSYTLAGEMPPRGFVVEPYVVPDWYVNPAGDDNNDGCTPETPKKTLAAALALAISGDTVHAAPGRYEEGSALYTADRDFTTRTFARAVVNPGVSLVADEGPETTFIVGQAATQDADGLGCGAGAVRCVSLAENGLVCGFTLTGGRTITDATVENPSYNASVTGGGVVGLGNSARHLAVVRDCVITDCASLNGGAARLVLLVNTRVTGNRSTYGVVSECDLIGTVVDGNYADESSCYRFTYVFDSTIGPNAYTLAGTPGVALGETSSAVSILANTLVLGTCSTAKTTVPVSNCLFRAGCVTGKVMQNADARTRIAEDDLLQVDAALRPIAGRNLACDILDCTLNPTAARPNIGVILDEVRAARYTNGAPDVGALEADWRGVYAADIGGRAMTVETATKDVVESAAHTVYVTDGQELTATWAGKSGRTVRFTLPVRVEGTGTLTVTINGETRTFTAGDAVWEFGSALVSNAVAISYAGDGRAEILNGGRRTGTAILFR